MANYKVTLAPSGHSFESEGNESVLHAGLKAGMPLRFGCENGSCGDCKARIVEGEVEVGFHDFVIPEAERASGHVLLCRSRALTDLRVEAWEIQASVEIPPQRIKAKISRIDKSRDDFISLIVRTPRSRALQFLPGQRVSLQLPGLLPRYKSIASCPCDGANLEFHVPYLAGDPFCEYVFDDLNRSREVIVQGPEGEFSFDNDSRRPVIFFAYGSGFAPIKSLVEHAISLDYEQPMHLYWMVVHEGGHYMENVCRSWTDALEYFRYTPLCSQVREANGKAVWNEDKAMEQVVKDYPDLSGFDVYLAGSQALAETAGHCFARNGLPVERYFTDQMRHF